MRSDYGDILGCSEAKFIMASCSVCGNGQLRPGVCDGCKEIDLLKSELTWKNAEIAELRAALQTACGHSNCYCGTCKALSHKYFTPKPRREK